MKRLPKIFTAIILCLLAILKSGTLLACSCDGESTAMESVKFADIVFKGLAISKVITSDLSSYGVTIQGDTTSFDFKLTKKPMAIFKIKVDKIYKGKSKCYTLSVVTATSEAGCGFGFQVGQEYIVYGTTNDEILPGNSVKRVAINDQTFWTNLCTRTTRYFKTEEDEIQESTKKLESSISTFDFIKDHTIADTANALCLPGAYFISNGSSGFRLILDSNGTYQKFAFDCYGDSKVDSGSWTSQNKTSFTIHSDKTYIAYDVVKFDNYNFLISQAQKKQFIKDLLSTKAKFKNLGPITVDNNIYTVDFMIGYMLMEKYYAKELKSFTGI